MSNELPLGWTKAPLGSLGDWFGGGTPSKSVKEYWENGTVQWVSPKDMKRPVIDSAEDQITEKAVKESATNLVPANSVLMVTRSGILDHSFPVAVNIVPVTMNQDLKAVAVRGVDAAYVSYFLQSRARDILRRCKKDGTTVASIDSDRLTAYEVAIAPAQEQKRIVSKIDELFSRIDEGERALERVQTLVERYRQSLLKAAVTGELTRTWREKTKENLEPGEAVLTRILAARREAWETAELKKMKSKGIRPPNDGWRVKYEEPPQPDKSGRRALPEGWTWASVDQLSIDVGYGTSAKCDDDPTGVPVIRMGNINDGKLDLTDLKYLPAKHKEFPSLLLKTGDLLFNRTNSAELVGKSAVFLGVDGAWSFASYLIRVRVAVVNSEWIAHYINSVLGRAWIATVKSQQVGQANVNGSKLKALAIPLPPANELDTALDILVRELERVRSAEQANENERRRAGALRQAVLSAAFSGRLVRQDRADESASTLLQRIAAERSTANETPKRGRKSKSVA